MSEFFEKQSIQFQTISLLLPIYVMHRQQGLSESEALDKAKAEIDFVIKNCGGYLKPTE